MRQPRSTSQAPLPPPRKSRQDRGDRDPGADGDHVPATDAPDPAAGGGLGPHLALDTLGRVYRNIIGDKS